MAGTRLLILLSLCVGLTIWLGTVGIPGDARRLAKVLEGRGRAYLLADELHGAEVNLSQSVQLDPSNMQALSELGYVYLETGRFSSARSVLEVAVTNQPDLLSCLSLGHVYEKLNLNSLAMKCYEEALRINPKCSDAWEEIGLVLLSQGRLVEAEASLRRSIDVDPTCSECYDELGRVLRKEGLLREATECFVSATKLDASNDRAWFDLVRILEDRGLIADAELAARKSLAHNPRNAAVWAAQARLLLTQGRPTGEALRSANQAVELAPKIGDAWETLGDVLRSQGVADYGDAQVAYNRAMQLFSTQSSTADVARISRKLSEFGGGEH